MMVAAEALGIADGPTEVHKVTLARQLLKRVPAGRRAVPVRAHPHPPRRSPRALADRLLEHEVAQL